MRQDTWPVVWFEFELRLRDRVPSNVPTLSYQALALGGIRFGPPHNKVGFGSFSLLVITRTAQLEGSVFDQPKFRLKCNSYLLYTPK